MITALFFDFLLQIRYLGIEVKGKKARVFDDGNTKSSLTNVATIGKALLKLLTVEEAREKVKNKHVYIRSVLTIQNEIVAALEEVSGSKFEVSRAKSADVKKAAAEKLKKGDTRGFLDTLQCIEFGEEELSLWKRQGEEGNAALLSGISEMRRRSWRP